MKYLIELSETMGGAQHDELRLHLMQIGCIGGCKVAKVEVERYRSEVCMANPKIDMMDGIENAADHALRDNARNFVAFIHDEAKKDAKDSFIKVEVKNMVELMGTSFSLEVMFLRKLK